MKKKKTSAPIYRFSKNCFCFDYVLYFLSYVGSRDLDRQWPAVHNQTKQRFLNETSKIYWSMEVLLSALLGN